MKYLRVIICALLSACTQLADPESMRAPQTAEERAEWERLYPGVERTRQALMFGNREVCDWSAPRCVLNVSLSIAGGVGSFARDGYVWVPTGMAEFLESDAEFALVMAHEWSHNILGHAGGDFSELKESQADCLGTLLAERAGYDAIAASDVHRRLAASELRTQIGWAFFGVYQPGAKFDWGRRRELIAQAATQGRQAPLTKARMQQICGVTF